MRKTLNRGTWNRGPLHFIRSTSALHNLFISFCWLGLNNRSDFHYYLQRTVIITGIFVLSHLVASISYFIYDSDYIVSRCQWYSLWRNKYTYNLWNFCWSIELWSQVLHIKNFIKEHVFYACSMACTCFKMTKNST